MVWCCFVACFCAQNACMCTCVGRAWPGEKLGGCLVSTSVHRVGMGRSKRKYSWPLVQRLLCGLEESLAAMHKMWAGIEGQMLLQGSRAGKGMCGQKNPASVRIIVQDQPVSRCWARLSLLVYSLGVYMCVLVFCAATKTIYALPLCKSLTNVECS